MMEREVLRWAEIPTNLHFCFQQVTFDETPNGLQKSAFREQHTRILESLDGGLLFSYICAARTSAVTLMISASHLMPGHPPSGLILELKSFACVFLVVF